MSDIVLRPYRRGDFSLLVRLMEELQDHLVAVDTMGLRRREPEYGLRYTRRLLASVRAGDGVVLFAEEEDSVVGCVVVIIERQRRTDLLEWVPHKTGRIPELFVRTSCRGKGVGAKLMRAAEQYCQSQSCDVVRVEVLSSNVRARSFYEKLGYAERYADLIKRL